LNRLIVVRARDLRLSCLLLGTLLGLPSPARAGDIVAFVSDARPEELWEHGYGAALSFSFFRVATFEGEAARMPAIGDGREMTSFTGSALLSPPIGKLVPYAGLGVGLYRQTASDTSDTDTLRVLVVGLKVGLGGLVVLKAEYRDFELPDDALLLVDKRFSIGAGISF
jgi:hypothetical protein